MNVQRKIKAALAAAGVPALLLMGAASAHAQSSDPGSAYIQMMNEMGGNPADFNIDDGRALWQKKAGPKNASLEQCDLGLGPGVVKGAYAQLPRYFADTGRVQDAESRIVTCMEQLQGIPAKQAEKGALADHNGNPSALEDMVLYVAKESDGMPIAIPQSTPQEKAAYENGKKLFFYRAGPFSFSCAACHAESGKRIRVSLLPNLTNAEAAQSYATWPAYPNSQGVARTLEWRMKACARQQRWPVPKFTSDAVIDLIEYMGVNSNGAKLTTPTFKR